MKYSLAFDQGEKYPEQERYVPIPLSRISPDLDTDDNFKALCGFTMQYVNEADLKKVILANLPEFRFYRSSSLVILKGKRHLGEIVPYRQMRNYFDLQVLEQIIIRNIADKGFRDSLLAPYSHIKYFAIVSNDLRRAGEKGFDYVFLKKCVVAFLTKICMEESLIDYRQLYKMAALVMSSLGLLYDSTNQLDEFLEDNDEEQDIDSSIQFQKEWLIRRARIRQLDKW